MGERPCSLLAHRDRWEQYARLARSSTFSNPESPEIIDSLRWSKLSFRDFAGWMMSDQRRGTARVPRTFKHSIVADGRPTRVQIRGTCPSGVVDCSRMNWMRKKKSRSLHAMSFPLGFP